MEPKLKATSARAERFADLLMLSDEPMLAWRLDGPIEFWNAGAERLYGFPADEAIGCSSHALLQTKFPLEFTHLCSQLKDQHSWTGELRHSCKDGREVVVDSRMQLLSDGTVLEVNRDVTEVKSLAADKRGWCENCRLLPPNSKPFSTNLAFSPALWTWTAICGRRTTCP